MVNFVPDSTSKSNSEDTSLAFDEKPSLKTLRVSLQNIAGLLSSWQKLTWKFHQGRPCGTSVQSSFGTNFDMAQEAVLSKNDAGTD